MLARIIARSWIAAGVAGLILYCGAGANVVDQGGLDGGSGPRPDTPYDPGLPSDLDFPVDPGTIIDPGTSFDDADIAVVLDALNDLGCDIPDEPPDGPDPADPSDPTDPSDPSNPEDPDDPTPVPEPASLPVMMSSLALLGWRRLRRR
ncbi:MAG: PEP-CTERM sorting domain-containing protein [Alphaproteobacteria bacterium]|nr:MAG: PEP-CTERM sorting domain-containing protein [Alphaproteobacteria bacterium]